MAATPFTSKLEFVRNENGDVSAIKLVNVRLSYPKLFKAEADRNNPQSAPKFGANFIANLSDPEKQELAKFLKDLAQRAFKKAIAADRYFVKRGDDMAKPEYEGCMVFSSSETERNPPKVYNKHGLLTRSENEVYSGCMVTAIIQPWVQDNQYGQRINASLRGVRFVADNEPFGGRALDPADLLGCDPNQPEPPADQHVPGFTPNDDSDLPFKFDDLS